MEVGTIILGFRVTSTLEVIGIGIVNFLVIFVKDLKFHEVDSLLKKVNIAELFDMEHKLSAGSVHNYA